MSSLNILNPPAIHGPVVPGEAIAVRSELEQLISQLNINLFDIGALLYKIKKNGYYETTFHDYINSLKFKPSKARYLTRIAEVTETLNIPRETYEPLGIVKLREITSLDIKADWTNPETKEKTPISHFVTKLIEHGQTIPVEEVRSHVKVLKGLVGTEAMSWVHLYMKQLAIDQVVKPALELAKAQIGSVAEDEEGYKKDASDGQAAEIIFVSYLNDPANGITLLNSVEPVVNE